MKMFSLILFFFLSNICFAREDVNALLREYRESIKNLITEESQNATEFSDQILKIKDNSLYRECVLQNDDYSDKCELVKNELKKNEKERQFKRKNGKSYLNKLLIEKRIKNLGEYQLLGFIDFLDKSLEAIFFEVDVKYAKNGFDLIPRNCKRNPILCQLEIRHNIINTSVQEKLLQFEEFALRNLENFYREDGCETVTFREHSKPIDKTELKNFEKLIFSLHENFYSMANKSTNEKYKSLRGPYLRTNAFQIKISDGDSVNRICTATHLKINNKCSLLTNEHCIQNIEKPKVTLITGEINEPPGFSSREIKLSIKKVAPSSELVLLEPPNYFNEQYCDRLLETKIENSENLIGDYKTLHIAGYTKNGEADLFYNFSTDDQDLKNKTPHMKMISSGLAGVSHFLEVSYIDVGPGMSGGPLLDDKGNVLGITTRYIPFEDTPWIIPISDVQAFIENKFILQTSKNPKLFNFDEYKKSASPFFVADNIPRKPGDNIPRKPGDNIPRKPGDNIPRKPGDNIPRKPSEDDQTLIDESEEFVFQSFLDKPEGIVDFNDSKKRILLAVRCHSNSPWEQIDGNDDYIHKCDDVTTLDEKDKIYADEDGELPLMYKKKNFEILKGNYLHAKSSDSGRHVTFVEDLNSIDQMKKMRSNLQKDKLEISSDKLVVSLGKDKVFNFKVSETEKGLSLVSESHSVVLQCDGRSLTKIICQNNSMGITFSMIDSKTSELKYRVVIKKGKEVDYHYGKLFKKMDK